MNRKLAWMRIPMLIAVLLAAAAAAEVAGASPDAPMLKLTAGQAGIDRSVDSPGAYGLEYQLRPVGRYRLVPALGFSWVDNGASYLYAELKRDFRLENGFIVTPSFGLARFDASPDLQLGQTLEFRSGIEVGYELDNRNRIGIALYHLSNGGLARENPGTEVLMVSFTMPRG